MKKIVNRGKVRGGPNEEARFHLEIGNASGMTFAEAEALAEIYRERYSADAKAINGGEISVVYIPLNTRREFALAPLAIRSALESGFRVSTSQWDEGIKGRIFLDESPQLFWRELALAQTFYGRIR